MNEHGYLPEKRVTELEKLAIEDARTREEIKKLRKEIAVLKGDLAKSRRKQEFLRILSGVAEPE